MRTDLQRRCERALVAAARAAGIGTRQQVRAAARGFVRRHRRNGSYLTFVLRGVLANSALAIGLLGLAPAPVHAAAPLFAERTGAANPMGGPSTAFVSLPAGADLDGDGDLDLVSGDGLAIFHYYENTGTAASAAYIERTGPANPLDGQAGLAATFGDLDGDGDLDLIAGEADGTFAYYENINSAAHPQFAWRTGSANPLEGYDLGSDARPVLGDLDGDGDLDLVSGATNGTFFYFENVGTATAPGFELHYGGPGNPLDGDDVGLESSPALGDVDGDGDLDLVSGGWDGSFLYYENTGSATLPAFVLRAGGANPLDGYDVGTSSGPTWGDLDSDGDLDLIAGEVASSPYSSFHYYENLSGRFVPQTGGANPLAGQNVGFYSAPAFGDLDGDGDRDVIAGQSTGTFFYFRNTGNAASPAFAVQTGGANPMNGQDVGSYGTAALGDLDGDGDLDLVAGDQLGAFSYFRNDGTASAPVFVPQTGAANPLNGQAVGYRSTPALADLDGDGDLDLVAGNTDGVFAYYQNTGTVTVPSFVPRTGALNPLDGQDVGSRSTAALADVDGDGDLDLVSGEHNTGSFLYFENTGSRTAAAFAARTGSANPLDGESVVAASTPALGDLDADGDPDLVAGQLVGGFFFYENAIVRPSPRYFQKIVPSLVGVYVGSFSAPAAGDLDGDGDPDLVASEAFASGAIHYYENTGSALAPKLVERTGAANPLDGLSAGTAPRLALGDVDADGDLDLVSGDGYFNPVQFFANEGTAIAPLFVELTGAANPFAGVVEGRSAPSFGDVDGDGDLDLVVGEIYGVFHYYENTADVEDPAFAKRTGAANPFDGLAVGPGNFATPALGDVDRDGDLDLVAGDEAYGLFHYYENTGSVTSPAYVERTGAANPLDGKDAGSDSSPAFVDLDADGDADLVSGNSAGALIPYYLPEPARALALGAGIGLIRWLARWRRRAGWGD